jgi:hypothetical protein
MKYKVKNKKVCPKCGNSYKQIAQHWRWNSSHRPNLTNKQRQVITGLMMGDGCLNRGNKNPRVEISMISKNYLEHLDDMFGCLSNGVRISMTASESAERNMKRESFPSNVVNKENYNDLYKFTTCGHPELSNFNWYKTGRKVWPDDINLNPTILKHWYVGDGYHGNMETYSYISIALSNEVKNKEKVESYFDDSNLPIPDNWKIYKSSDERINAEIIWNKDNSHKLFEYMGEPLPDFEYKWPKPYRKT